MRLLGEVGRDLRLELVESQVLALGHHPLHELGAVALGALERRQDEQPVQIGLFLHATRAEVVTRAALHELLHQTAQHAARDAAGGASNGIERNEILRTERKWTRARNRVARESCRAVEAAADEAVDEARVDGVDAARG